MDIAQLNPIPALIPALDTALNWFWVAVGLGLVIFFHELGHFAVAKWCGVLVERFSIGFGPILWSWKRGETEYALSAIPFGGYVKMLGQDDIDPSQLTSEEISQDPRSYSAKSVPQRMAIISAGVIMNVVTGLLFFAVAFGLGVQTSPPVLGEVVVGKPAWKAGLRQGDVVLQINGRTAQSFNDIMRGVALTTGPVTLHVRSESGREFVRTIEPDASGKRRQIGVGPAQDVRLIAPPDESISPTAPGTPAALATPPFQPGDWIRRVDDVDIASFAQLQDVLARRRDKTVRFLVQRKGAPAGRLEAISVAPGRFRSPGVWVAMGQIAAIVDGSPAHQAGLQVGDKILEINGRIVGQTADPLPEAIDPIRLPDVLAALHGQEVEISVKRQGAGGAPETRTVRLEPDDRPGWIERPHAEGVPLSVPAAGFAYHLIPTILHVEPGSPAAAAQLQVGDIIRKLELILPEGTQPRNDEPRILEVDFDPKKKENWAYAFWLLQADPTRTVRMHVSRNGSDLVADLGALRWTREDREAWYLPVRGLRLAGLAQVLEADNAVEAVQMGITHTTNSISDIYLTIRSLFSGNLSFKELHGPIGIAKVAYDVVQLGLADLLLFLGFLSVNLAVLNFLPIPVLDGGHMVFLAWEAIARKKPSERVLVAATYFGMAFVLGLMLLVLYLDIFVHKAG